MEFRTKVDIPPNEKKIDHASGILLMGSCFADYMGSKLKLLKFNVSHNPFGVLYNPMSIAVNLETLIHRELFTESDLYYFNKRWISFYHYTSFSDPEKSNALKKINESIKSASAILADAKFLFITFGTSWVYEFLKTGKIVANCHKIPARQFRRFLLNADDIAEVFDKLIPVLNEFNPGLEIIFTVSPIRHLKDGATGNQVSKSVLFVAIHRLLQKHQKTGYFPAYEIFMDELRDYRFYAGDMVHPSEVAVDYIWERFSEAYMTGETISVLKEADKLIKARNHRPFSPDSPDYFEFREKMLKKTKDLQLKYPFLDLSEELKFFS